MANSLRQGDEDDEAQIEKYGQVIQAWEETKREFDRDIREAKLRFPDPNGVPAW